VSGGRLIGVGTGPGDPELLTLKAVKALGQADVLAHFAKRGNAGNARAIIGAHARPDWIELPLLYPVTTEIDKNDGAYKGQILDFYEESATAIARHLEAGRTVAVLSEGDPLLWLLHAFACASGASLSDGSHSRRHGDVRLLVAGRSADRAGRRRVDRAARHDGRGRIDPPACRYAGCRHHEGREKPAQDPPRASGGWKLGGAIYVERGTMANTASISLARKADDVAPYFSIVLVPGWTDRPQASIAKVLDAAT
jgi:precorrin-2/cobalt-factor-2 C20-methyltransferase